MTDKRGWLQRLRSAITFLYRLLSIFQGKDSSFACLFRMKNKQLLLKVKLFEE